MIFTFCFCHYLYAKDFGILSKTWEIKEQKFSERISNRLSQLDIYKEQLKIASHIRDLASSPNNLGLGRKTGASEENPKSFAVDLSYIVQKDIIDLNGNIIAKKGKVINPFDHITLSQDIVILDGSDQKQISWLAKHYKDREYILILTGGSPIELGGKLGKQVYFDQNRVWVDKFRIKTVPSIIKQENKEARVYEISL